MVSSAGHFQEIQASVEAQLAQLTVAQLVAETAADIAVHLAEEAQ
ncbi:hypothetical protein [Limosilactobacillus ingluviei]|nr:hypothetical protein [Limosilactobacillus ingluviei]